MRYEFIKLFSNKKIIIIIVVMFGINIFLATRNSTVMYEGFNSKVYEFYMESLQGEYNEDKYIRVMNEYAEMQDLLAKEGSYLQQYKDKILSVNEYKEISSDISMAKSRIKTIEYVVEKTQYYSQCKNMPSYFYDIDVNDYIENMSVNIPLLICLILIVSFIFCEDYYSNTISMIRSSKNGKNILCFNRMMCVCICSITLSVVFYIGEFGVKILLMNLGDINANISSLMCMKNTTLNVTISEYILLTIIYRTFFGIIVGIIFSVVAICVHKYIVMFMTSLGIVFIPVLITDNILIISKGLEAYPLLSSAKRIFGFQIMYMSVFIYLVFGSVLLGSGYYLIKRYID